MHSGTGRISRMMMRPMSLYESNESNGKISLIKLFDDKRMDIDGIQSQLLIEKLVFAACRGGWPSSLSKKVIRPVCLLQAPISKIFVKSMFQHTFLTLNGLILS